MKESYKIVYEGASDEIVEKKSRFIGIVYPIDNEDEALAFIEDCKKKYWDARHRCFAYAVGENMELQRFSDDGEPQGPAGKPILDVILNNDIHNCLIIVVRYFGGTLLGTGGLVRAYSQASKAALDKCEIIDKTRGYVLEIETDYNGIGKIQYLLGNRQLEIWKSDYADNVKLQVLVPVSQKDAVMSEITEATAGRGIMKAEEEIFFAKTDRDIITFE